MALPLDMKTYSDVSCGDVKVFEDKGSETEVEGKQVSGQNDTNASVANVSVNCDDTTAQVLHSIVAEVSKKSVQCEDKSSNIVPEVVHKSVQCEELIGSNGLNHSVTELLSKAVQCEDFHRENSVNESSFNHSIGNDTMNSDVSKIVNLSSMSTQTDVNDDIVENLQKQIQEKDVTISLKEEIIVKLQDSLKSKENEIEKMSASLEFSRQSIIPAPEQPSTASSTPQRPRPRGRPGRKPKSTAEKEDKHLEGAKEVVDTDTPKRETRKSQGAKTDVEIVKESPETSRRNTRSKLEPEPKVEAGESKSKVGRKRKITDKSEDESSAPKQVKAPIKEKRGATADSATTKGKTNREGKSYSLRNRK